MILGYRYVRFTAYLFIASNTNTLRSIAYMDVIKSAYCNDVEIDFIISNESKMSYRIIPVEVKSSKNYTTTSLDQFRALFGKRIAESYIVHPKNYSREKDIVKYPAYMFPFVI